MVNSILIFIATIAGIFAYFLECNTAIFITVGIILIIGIAATIYAHHITRRQPIRANWLIMGWRAVPLSLIFLGAYGSAWFSLNLLDHLPFNYSEIEEVAKAERATVKALTTTAVSALLAAILLDAARDPESEFWPAERYKQALKAAFHNSPAFKTPAAGITKEVKHAIQDLRAAYIGPKTTDRKASGWSFKARKHRAKVIRASIDTLNANGIDV